MATYTSTSLLPMKKCRILFQQALELARAIGSKDLVYMDILFLNSESFHS